MKSRTSWLVRVALFARARLLNAFRMFPDILYLLHSWNIFEKAPLNSRRYIWQSPDEFPVEKERCLSIFNSKHFDLWGPNVKVRAGCSRCHHTCANRVGRSLVSSFEDVTYILCDVLNLCSSASFF